MNLPGTLWLNCCNYNRDLWRSDQFAVVHQGIYLHHGYDKAGCKILNPSGGHIDCDVIGLGWIHV